MHQELVEKRHWISEDRFLHALNYCMLLPGPEAQQLATYLGWLLHGVRGGIVAGLLFILPSLLLLIALTWGYLVFGHFSVVNGILYGVKPAVIAIVLFAAYRIGRKALKNYVLKMIAFAAFFAILVFSVPFPIIVISAGFIGYIGAKWLPESFQNFSKNTEINDPVEKVGVDLTARHVPVNWKRPVKFLVVGLCLWLVPMCLLS